MERKSTLKQSQPDLMPLWEHSLPSRMLWSVKKLADQIASTFWLGGVYVQNGFLTPAVTFRGLRIGGRNLSGQFSPPCVYYVAPEETFWDHLKNTLSGLFHKNQQQNSQQVPCNNKTAKSTLLPTPTLTPSQQSSGGWQTYSSPILGIQFQYPSDFINESKVQNMDIFHRQSSDSGSISIIAEFDSPQNDPQQNQKDKNIRMELMNNLASKNAGEECGDLFPYRQISSVEDRCIIIETHGLKGYEDQSTSHPSLQVSNSKVTHDLSRTEVSYGVHFIESEGDITVGFGRSYNQQSFPLAQFGEMAKNGTLDPDTQKAYADFQKILSTIKHLPSNQENTSTNQPPSQKQIPTTGSTDDSKRALTARDFTANASEYYSRHSSYPWNSDLNAIALSDPMFSSATGYTMNIYHDIRDYYFQKNGAFGLNDNWIAINFAPDRVQNIFISSSGQNIYACFLPATVAYKNAQRTIYNKDGSDNSSVCSQNRDGCYWCAMWP